jgi:hypothetical protein
MLYANNRLHGDGKINTGVTTKLSEIKSCNRTGYHTALNKQKPTSHDKLLMAPRINHNWGSIHPAPQYRFHTSLSE